MRQQKCLTEESCFFVFLFFSFQWTLAFLARNQTFHVMIGVSSWRSYWQVTMYFSFIYDNYILVKLFLTKIDCSCTQWLPVALVCVEVLREGKVLCHSVCLYKESIWIVPVIKLCCGCGAMISLVWSKGWLPKGVVFVSYVSLLPFFHWIWAC